MAGTGAICGLALYSFAYFAVKGTPETAKKRKVVAKSREDKLPQYLEAKSVVGSGPDK